jgi:hypothetical protein
MKTLSEIKIKRDLLIAEIESDKAVIRDKEIRLSQNLEILRAYNAVLNDFSTNSEDVFKIYPLQKVDEKKILQVIKKINRFCNNEEIVTQLYSSIKLTDGEISELKTDVSTTLGQLRKKKLIVRKGSYKFSEWGLPSFSSNENSLLGILGLNLEKRLVGVLD